MLPLTQEHMYQHFREGAQGLHDVPLLLFALSRLDATPKALSQLKSTQTGHSEVQNRHEMQQAYFEHLRAAGLMEEHIDVSLPAHVYLFSRPLFHVARQTTESNGQTIDLTTTGQILVGSGTSSSDHVPDTSHAFFSGIVFSEQPPDSSVPQATQAYRFHMGIRLAHAPLLHTTMNLPFSEQPPQVAQGMLYQMADNTPKVVLDPGASEATITALDALLPKAQDTIPDPNHMAEEFFRHFSILSVHANTTLNNFPRPHAFPLIWV